MTAPALRWGAATDAGLVREANEDAHLVVPPLFVVADGMGGHQAGEVASALAVEVMRTRLAGTQITFDAMVDAVVEANRAIYATAAGNAAQLGMGTTLTALALASGDLRDIAVHTSADDDTGDLVLDPPSADDTSGEHSASSTDDPATAHAGDPLDQSNDGASADGSDHYLVVVNVGDSRTYRVRAGELQRATLDHSYVQELINAGHLTDAEARLHPRRNIVTRALGIEADVVVDAWALPVVHGDRFVLCSDGLVDEVVDTDIRDIVTTAPDPQTAADLLVAAAIANGGRDNITVVVVDVLGPDPLVDDDAALADAAANDRVPPAEGASAAAPSDDAPAAEGPSVGHDGPSGEPSASLDPDDPAEPAPLEDDTGPIPAVVPAASDPGATPIIRPPATTSRSRGPIIAAIVALAVLIVIGVIVLLAITGGDDASGDARAHHASAAHIHVDTAPTPAADDGSGMG